MKANSGGEPGVPSPALAAMDSRQTAGAAPGPVAMRAGVPGFIVGKDLLPGGRFLRLLAGLLFLAAAVDNAHHRGLTIASVPEQVIPAFVLVTLGYVILIRILGERLIARVNGWLAAIVLVAPSAVLSALPFVPATVSVGFILYLAAGLLAQAAIGYGGCEVAGLPALILRRRYRVYCAFSGADVVEFWLRSRPAWARWGMMLLALLATGGLFLLVGAITPAWFQNYGEYLLFLATGYVINWIVTTTVSRWPSPRRICASNIED